MKTLYTLLALITLTGCTLNSQTVSNKQYKAIEVIDSLEDEKSFLIEDLSNGADSLETCQAIDSLQIIIDKLSEKYVYKYFASKSSDKKLYMSLYYECNIAIKEHCNNVCSGSKKDVKRLEKHIDSLEAQMDNLMK